MQISAVVRHQGNTFPVPLPKGTVDQQFDEIVRRLDEQSDPVPFPNDAEIDIPQGDGTTETRTVKRVRKDRASGAMPVS